jgi:hypothetical protein
VLQGADLNTEHLLAPFSVAAVLVPLVARDEVGRRRDLLLALAGVCAGVSVLSKVIGAAVVIPALILVLSPVLADRRAVLRSVVVYLGAAAVPLVLVVAFFAATGGLSDFWFGNWSYNRRYLDQYVARHGRPPWTVITHLSVLVALSGAAVTAYLGARQGRSAFAWATLLWLATTFLSGLYGAREYPHYYVPMIAPAAIALALPIAALASRPLRGLGIALAAIVLLTWLPPLKRTFGRNGDEMVAAVYGEDWVPIWGNSDEVGRGLRARAKHDDLLWVAGAEPEFYWDSGLAPASRYLFDYPKDVTPAEFARSIRGEVCRKDIRFVVLPTGRLPGYASCLRGKEYQEAFRVGPVVVWQRP